MTTVSEILPVKTKKPKKVSVMTRVLDEIYAGNTDINTLINLILSITKSNNSACVLITKIRNKLKHFIDNYDTLHDIDPNNLQDTEDHKQELKEVMDGLINNPKYTEIKTLAKQEIMNNLDKKDLKRATDQNTLLSTTFGSILNVDRKLNAIVKSITSDSNFPMSLEVLVYALINFSARPADLYNMSFDADNQIHGFRKQRGKDTPAPYVGILDIDDAKILLDFVQSHQEYNPDQTDNKIKYNKLLDQLHKAYNCSFRCIRMYAANLIASQQPSRILQLSTRQKALRHANLDTSVLHYST